MKKSNFSEVIFFTTKSGTSPVEKWMSNLTDKEIDRISVDIRKTARGRGNFKKIQGASNL